jgi:nicotinamidase-related amidase
MRMPLGSCDCEGPSAHGSRASDERIRIVAVKTCLLIIDLQRGLLAEPPPPTDAEEVINRINALAARARVRGIPVIFVQHEEEGLRYRSASWQLDPRVHVAPPVLRVRKRTVDSFFETNLLALLQDLDINDVTICGYATEFCVDTTVRRAAALGFSVTLVSDAHTTQDKPHLKASSIRQHHNRTLEGVTSFAGRITVQPAASLW